MRRTIGIALTIMLALAPAQAADVIPGRWQKVEALEPGTPIIVRLKSGDRLEVRLREVGPESLSLTDLGDRELTVPRSSVERIETAAKVRDGLANGALIGAGVGSAAAFLALTGYAYGVTASGPVFDRESMPYFTAAALVGAGIGAVAGLAIDGAVRGREVIYRAR